MVSTKCTRSVKKILLWLFAILILIQFIQPVRNHGAQVVLNDISNVIAVPDNIRGILKKACYDCHSEETVYPWYANIQPLNWFLNSHIQKGKSELNFSEFSMYSTRKQQNKLSAIENSFNDNSMPLSSYTIVHRGSVLSSEEKALLRNWIQSSKDSLIRKNF
ncbi:heme-binding domain-containing protein [Pedobacter antarcticus]|uniref:heme-binding domain-containing protein n=1 Tax=Pedobacter antarcticus TaxID=34086 RepID=UPI00292FA291|nr:heme-binding domain-containing protein [Pedobacter antarcticus]